MKVLLIGKFDNSFVKTRLDAGDEVCIYSSDQLSLNRVKLKFRDYKNLVVSSYFDVVGMQYVDIIYMNESFDIPKKLLDICSEVVTDLPFDDPRFYKTNGRYVKIGQIMSFSSEHGMFESSTVIVRSIKPIIRSFELEPKIVPGKLAIALKPADIFKLSGIKYLDIDLYLFSDKPLDGFHLIEEPSASKERMLKVIETLSNAEFKIVL